MTIRKIVDALDRESSQIDTPYYIPSLWKNPYSSKMEILKIDPFEFYLSTLNNILDSPDTELIKGEGRGEWSKNAIIYNIFVRTTTTFDHNNNGKIDITFSKSKFRETGTFLKTIALLPYIKSLGVNVIHLLPITTIGSDGNKGTLGSPYAIRNPYQLDSNLAEPILQLDVDTEFTAFVETAHHLGIRIAIELVLRTAAKDCDWIKDHPDWFYWIKADIQDRPSNIFDENYYGNPIFSQEELDYIKRRVGQNQFDCLIPPHEIYRRMFTTPPLSESIEKIGSGYIGTSPDGVRVRIPGAFADWPPDDIQPPWGDITYLKLYNHPDFNYIAYNTIRMYDSRLIKTRYINKPLWEKIVGIIPYFQKKFNIDALLLDMGHALPSDLKQMMISKARRINPDFAFWDEKFDLDEHSRQSRKEGYNAILGNYWWIGYHIEYLHKFLQRLTTHEIPIPFFIAPETHNTPRARTRKYGILISKLLWALGCLCPGIPFIHSGFELQETYPINTGLDFTSDELTKYPSEKLPLFSEYAYDWSRRSHIIDWIRKILKIRLQHMELITNSDPKTFFLLETNNSNIIGIKRATKYSKRLFGYFNTNFKKMEWLNTPLKEKLKFQQLIGDHEIIQKNKYLQYKMNPGESLILCGD